MKTNYHTHTRRCQHAQGCEEDYVKMAIQKHCDILGFSDHAPYPDNRFGLRMPYQELNLYHQEVNRLKQAYPEIKLYCGLEIEYDPTLDHYYEDLLTQFDYLICGQHFYPHQHEAINIYSLEKTHSTAAYIDYANSLKEAMNSGYFACIAHPDVIFINAFEWDENCEKACDIIIEAAKQTQSVLEFNANGLRRGLKEYPDGLRYPYPHEKFWEKVSHFNIPVIINGDAHSPDAIYDEATEMAKQLAEKWHLHLIQTLPIKEQKQ